MALIQRRYSISDFSIYMSGMRGYIKENITDPSHITSEKVQQYYDSIKAHAYIHDNHISRGEYIVNCTFTDNELDIFISLLSWATNDDEEFDWLEFFKTKNEKYQEETRQKFLSIKKAYDNYLQSDIVDSRGKKTKAHFYRLTGYTPGQLSAALELCSQ